MGVGKTAATTLALAIHELATNSLKYGALSAEEGALDVSGGLDEEDVKIVWTERGGPAVEPPNGAVGYGSRLVVRSISGQLGGSIDYNWSAEGVIVTLILKASKLTA